MLSLIMLIRCYGRPNFRFVVIYEKRVEFNPRTTVIFRQSLYGSATRDGARAPRQPGVSVQLGDELRRSLMQLDEERLNIELEVAQLNEILNTDIGVGMHGPPIDSENYPRSDIDVHLARISRHRVSCLQTDHSHIMTQIQYKLHQLHSITRDSEASNT